MKNIILLPFLLFLLASCGSLGVTNIQNNLIGTEPNEDLSWLFRTLERDVPNEFNQQHANDISDFLKKYEFEESIDLIIGEHKVYSDYITLRKQLSDSSLAQEFRWFLRSEDELAELSRERKAKIIDEYYLRIRMTPDFEERIDLIYEFIFTTGGGKHIMADFYAEMAMKTLSSKKLSLNGPRKEMIRSKLTLIIGRQYLYQLRPLSNTQIKRMIYLMKKDNEVISKYYSTVRELSEAAKEQFLGDLEKYMESKQRFSNL